MILYKNNTLPGFAVKGVDLAKRTIEAYGSWFGNVDSDGDAIAKGSFIDTIRELGPAGKDRIAHCWQHDLKNPIGKIWELFEDSKGLAFLSYLPETRQNDDILKLYEAGILKEHSIGFRALDGKKQSNYYLITKVRLFEISTVTLAANELAGMRDSSKALRLGWLNREMQTIQKELYTGTYTDDTFRILQKSYNFYRDTYREVETEPAQKSYEYYLREFRDAMTNKFIQL